jgi:hypothetical protein
MRTIILILFSIFCTLTFSQNLDNEFTDRDFMQRNSTKLKYIITQIDTLTNKQITKTALIATFNPKTKITTIQNFDPPSKHYVITDNLNQLRTVDTNGKEDTINFIKCHTERINDSTTRSCDMFTIYNHKGQIVKAVTDTNSSHAMNLYETYFYYSGDTLKRKITKSFIFYANSSVDKYNPNEPEEITETIYNGNIEISARSQLMRPSKKTLITKTITEKKIKTVINKTYSNNKLIEIGTYIFE